MNFARAHRVLVLAGMGWMATAAFAAESAAPRELRVELVNNQPFPIRMPMRVHLTDAEAAALRTGEVAQRVGNDFVFIADVPAGTRRPLAGTSTDAGEPVSVEPEPNGVRLRHGGRDLGRLSWDILLKPAPRTAGDAAPPPEDFASQFTPLPLVFHRTADGAVCVAWTADAAKAGLRLTIELVAYRGGFVDVNARLANEASERATGVYAAVVARWEQPAVSARTLCEDNRTRPLAPRDLSRFRRGEGRHLFTQRGVDWIETTFAEGGVAAWLNDFAPSFTLLDGGTRNTFHQPRYYGANLPQLGQEVQTLDTALYSVTEIARSNIRSYRDRLAEYALPARGDGVAFSSRLVFRRAPFAAGEADQLFVAYTGFNEQRRTARGIELAFGADSVRFGTAYFPYSTLGENFDAVKLPGMDRESFWPLAADTVLRWREFADEIRRDLRLIKAMGFQLVRLHHLELLAPIPADKRREYLEFLFGELRHLQLRAMLDVYADPASIAELVARYADVIDAVEFENEILIWGIPVDRPDTWRQTYAAIKAAAPHVRVHLTGYNNTGMFNRLATLGVPFDRMGLHSYVDSLDAVPTARGYALALGSHASKIGKAPVITEWNWRGLTRLTPEARAAIYPAIFDQALSTRAIPELHQFQFNETLAPNPHVGRGNILRHYELVHLSRRPKLEAFELLKLIRKYSAPADPVRRLEVAPVVAEFDGTGAARAPLTITNRGHEPVRLRCSLEASADLAATLETEGEITLAAGASATIAVRLRTRDRTPGFYYAFVRFEERDGAVRYAWIEARQAGRPQLDVDSPSPAGVIYPQGTAATLRLDFPAPCVVVYGKNAPVLEVETAIAIAETLESASGRPVEALEAGSSEAAHAKHGTLILVGTPAADPAIAALATKLKVGRGGFIVSDSPAAPGAAAVRLVVGGDSSAAVEQAGMDFLLRYWKFAKDSAARRVGLERKTLPRGVDATKLP